MSQKCWEKLFLFIVNGSDIRQVKELLIFQEKIHYQELLFYESQKPIVEVTDHDY